MNVDGKTIVLGGKFSRTKKELKADLEALGAKVVSKVSASTDLVFVGKGGGKNYEAFKATQLGIPYHIERELHALIEAGNDVVTQDEAVPEVELEKSAAFEGKKVAVTGKFVIMKRAEVHELLEALGALVAKSVSKHTDLLIYGEGAGSKLDKAFQYGVEVMSELEMVELLEHDPRFVSRVPGARAIIDREIARQEAALPHVRKRVEPVWARQREQWGATLDELLLAYIQVLSQRRDLVVTGVKRRRKTGRWQLSYWTNVKAALPDEVLALFYHFGGIQFHYVFEEHASTTSSFSEGYRGGHINLVGINNFNWIGMEDWQKNDDDVLDFQGAGLFDYLQPEGYCDLSYGKDEKSKDAGVVFDRSSDVSRVSVGSVEAYLTRGAKAGFVWYWPNQGYWEAEEFKARLFERALPRDTPREVVEQKLVEKGLDAGMAHAMYEWLGQDTVILLHAD